jgi:hypothetical protein
MASYWIVVPRGNEELFELLSIAFRGRSDFSVIVDRRGAGSHAEGAARPARDAELGPDDFIVAEQSDKSGRPVDRAPAPRSRPRAVLRRPARRRETQAHRFFTL